MCVPFPEIEKISHMKNESTSMGNILVKSQPILKNDMRSGTAKEFSAIWDFARLCSFIRSEVMIKNVNGCIF